MVLGFAGLGHMGAAMVARLRDAGQTVIGYDVRAAPVEELMAKGGEAARSPADLGRRCDLIHSMVVNNQQPFRP